MSESVIADFLATFNAENTAHGEPTRGRVLLSQKRLVLAATDAERTTVPLSAVFDVAVGHVPPGLGDFFDSTVTIAFERGGDRYVAAVEADEETIDKFSTVLFKTLLNGTEMTVKHPARVGGRVTDRDFRPARLSIEPRRVRFRGESSTLDIPLSTVTGFGRSRREVGGSGRQVLEVRHMDEGESTMTLAATDSARKMSILGRYIRLEYSELLADVRELDVSKAEKEVLVALYSGAGSEGLSLPRIVDREPQEVTMLLNRLQEEELVVDARGGTKLTPKGRVVVNTHLEDVND
jgi:helix-turn-helix protein